MKSRCLYLIAAFLLFALTAQAADDLSIAAASDLQFVLPELTQQFEKQTGVKTTVSFGSSGNFAAQIRQGAPFDLFFSADMMYPKSLKSDGLIEPGSLFHYSDGKIVLWTLKSSKIDPRRGLSILLDPRIHKIALANPEHAPYGRAAVAALSHENVYSRIQSKIVLAENISQAAQFVDSGTAEVGIIALSLALAPGANDRADYYVIPQTDYPAIEQGCAIVKASPHKKAAREFQEFIKTPAALALFQKFGFAVGSTTGK